MKFLALLKSRKFWAALIALGLIVAQSYNHAFDGEQVTGMVVILVGYIVSIALDPGASGNKIIATLASRKFWLTVIGLIVVGANAFGLQLPVSQDAMIEISGVIGTLLVAMGYVDKQAITEVDNSIEIGE